MELATCKTEQMNQIPAGICIFCGHYHSSSLAPACVMYQTNYYFLNKRGKKKEGKERKGINAKRGVWKILKGM